MARIDENKPLETKVRQRRTRNVRNVKLALTADGRPYKRYGDRQRRTSALEFHGAIRRKGEKIVGSASRFQAGVRMREGQFRYVQEKLNKLRKNIENWSPLSGASKEYYRNVIGHTLQTAKEQTANTIEEGRHISSKRILP